MSPIQYGCRPPRKFAYQGVTTTTSCPSRASACGRAPATSPRPPVLLNGATSALTNRIRIAPQLKGQGGLRRRCDESFSCGRVYFVANERGVELESPLGDTSRSLMLGGLMKRRWMIVGLVGLVAATMAVYAQVSRDFAGEFLNTSAGRALIQSFGA